MAEQSNDDEIVKLSLSNLSRRSVNLFVGCQRLRLLKLAREAFNADSFDIWRLIDTEVSAAALASTLYVLSDKPNIQSVYGRHTAKLHRGRIAEASLQVLLRDEPDLPTLGFVAETDRQRPPSDVSLDQRRRLSKFLTQWEQDFKQQDTAKAPKTLQRSKRGRKPADSETVKKDQQVVEEWIRARDAGIRKADFVKDRKSYPKSVVELNRVIDRVDKRSKKKK